MGKKRHVRLKGSQREKNRVQCTQVKEREKKKKKKKEKRKMFLAHREEKQGRTRQSVVIFRQQLANIRALLILS